MASGTPAQRMLAINNLFAKNLQTAKDGRDQGVVKTGTVPSTVLVTTAMTGDTISDHAKDYEVDNRAELDAIKTVTEASATFIARNKTAHG